MSVFPHARLLCWHYDLIILIYHWLKSDIIRWLYQVLHCSFSPVVLDWWRPTSLFLHRGSDVLGHTPAPLWLICLLSSNHCPGRSELPCVLNTMPSHTDLGLFYETDLLQTLKYKHTFTSWHTQSGMPMLKCWPRLTIFLQICLTYTHNRVGQILTCYSTRT